VLAAVDARQAKKKIKKKKRCGVELDFKNKEF
jgi:hypothetical protein